MRMQVKQSGFKTCCYIIGLLSVVVIIIVVTNTAVAGSIKNGVKGKEKMIKVLYAIFL